MNGIDIRELIILKFSKVRDTSDECISTPLKKQCVTPT